MNPSRVIFPVIAMLSMTLFCSESLAQFDYINGWRGQLFPSYIIATATMHEEQNLPEGTVEGEDPNQQAPAEGDPEPADPNSDPEPADPNGEPVNEPEIVENVLGDPDTKRLLGVVVTAPENDTPIQVEIEAEGVLGKSVWSGVLEEADVEYTIYPSLKFNFKTLIANTQSIPIAVTFRVTLGDEEPVEHTVNTTLRSINDCPFALIYDKDNVEDISYMFAAYVNEQHPFVDKVLREALNRGVVDSFTGYQTNDPGEVLKQVYAIWDVLSRRDVRYSSITESAVVNQMVHSQHVRMIDQTINNAQANCVDGSALFASVLRKIGIHPALILVPGHCFLAYSSNPEGTGWVGLETTLVGNKTIEVGPDPEGDKIVGSKWAKERSWETFRAAVSTGNKRLEDDKDKLTQGNSIAYQIIPIAGARQKGILPIAFDSLEQFKSAKGKPE